VEDPMLEFVQLQQPKDVLLGFQRQWIDRLAQGFEA
jgi:hypothetical protein